MRQTKEIGGPCSAFQAALLRRVPKPIFGTRPAAVKQALEKPVKPALEKEVSEARAAASAGKKERGPAL